MLCGGGQTCPEGTFCGKMNENPNFGVTNLDNIFYAMLMVFQCTTLEGWSDIQTMYQKTYTPYIFVYFISMVFIGAFFLMNLTLAVINASFTKSQNAAKAEDEAKDNDKADKNDNTEDANLDDIEEALEQAEGYGEIGISEFFIAKRAARRMIEFLRMKQREKELKRLDEEEKLKIAANEAKGIYGDDTAREMTGRSNQPLMSGMSPDKKKQTPAKKAAVKGTPVVSHKQDIAQRHPHIITEEEIEEEANLDNHRNDVKNFLADLDAEKGATTTRGDFKPGAAAPKINMMQGL